MSTSEDKDPDAKIARVSSDMANKTTDETTKDEGVKSGSRTLGPQTLALNTHKAGMEGLDAEKINAIIKKASEGSKFYLHKQKCQQRLDAKISEMMKAKASFSEQQINKAVLQMDRLMDELELERDLTSTIVHVDMDMFYAAVEMRDDPSLRDKPMAVGGTGMLSTSNYAARKYGVRAAMPGFIGKKLCPELVIVPTNFTKYKECSKIVQSVFAEYDPNFSPMSLDEAFINITDYIKNNGHRYLDGADEADVGDGYVAERIVKEMREKIQAKTQLTASAGIAANTRLAKICSDLNKPNGQFYLPPNRQKILDFVAALPIRKVNGVGNVTEQHLSALDIKMGSDLLEKRGLLRLLFSDYNSFMGIALGLGSTSLEAWTERDRKSTSTETTFRGTADKDFLFKQTEGLCQELAEDLVEKDIFGKVFTLKIKTTDFKLKTKAHSFLEPTRACESMVSAARKLLQHEMDASSQPLSLRLIGVRMSSLVSSSEVGPSRQVTLTHMFSKSSHLKGQPMSRPSDNNSTQKRESKFEDKIGKGNSDSTSDVKINGCTESLAISAKEDCNVTSKKEQGTRSRQKSSGIDSFLSTSGRKSDATKNIRYECPVCYEQIEAASIVKFNIHVDKCLDYSSAKSSQPLSELDRDFVVEKRTVKLNRTVLDEMNMCQEDDERDSTRNETKKQKKDPFGDCWDSDPTGSKLSRDVEVQEEFSCPVCKKVGFTDINLLNKHLDECLSMGTIDKLVHEKESQPGVHSQGHQRAGGSSFFGALKSANNGKDVRRDASQLKKKQKTGHNTLEKYFKS